MKRVVLTGAAGGVGTRLRKLLPPLYTDLVLSDLTRPADLSASEKFIQADLADLAAVERALEGAEGVIHLGGFSVEGPWETILSANIVGCYNLFEAARRQGVKRVIFASSNHTVGFYPRSRKIGIDAPVLPDSRYGVSKAFGEALGAFYAHKFNLGVLAIRIGNFADAPIDKRRLAIWLRPDDLIRLIRIGLERPGLVYEVVYGASDNQRAWWNNARAQELGYRPEGKSEEFVEQAMRAQALLPPDPVGDHFQGGTFCSAEFAGDFDALKRDKT